MQTIAFLSQKGGSGKSTTAAALAFAALQRGLKVVILDTDHTQASLSKWGKRRGESESFISRAIVEAELSNAHEIAKAGGADLVIIDTQGAATSAATEAAKLADVVLIPSPPNRIDLETLATSKLMVGMAERKSGLSTYVVLTKVPHHELDTLAEVETVVARKFGLECAPIHTGLRKAYGKGLDSNLSPQEIERDGKVAAEINALLDFVNNSTSKHLKKRRA